MIFTYLYLYTYYIGINIFYLRYGEVFWTMMDPVPLDPDLVARFKDKTMAIVGYESDQG